MDNSKHTILPEFKIMGNRGFGDYRFAESYEDALRIRHEMRLENSWHYRNGKPWVNDYLCNIYPLNDAAIKAIAEAKDKPACTK